MLTDENKDGLEQGLYRLQAVVVFLDLLVNDYPCLQESPERMQRLLTGMNRINKDLQEISDSLQKAFDKGIYELATKKKTAAGTAAK